MDEARNHGKDIYISICAKDIAKRLIKNLDTGEGRLRKGAKFVNHFHSSKGLNKNLIIAFFLLWA